MLWEQYWGTEDRPQKVREEEGSCEKEAQRWEWMQQTRRLVGSSGPGAPCSSLWSSRSLPFFPSLVFPSTSPWFALADAPAKAYFIRWNEGEIWFATNWTYCRQLGLSWHEGTIRDWDFQCFFKKAYSWECLPEFRELIFSIRILNLLITRYWK